MLVSAGFRLLWVEELSKLSARAAQNGAGNQGEAVFSERLWNRGWSGERHLPTSMTKIFSTSFQKTPL